MKKIFTILTACLLLASCAEFTDLKPKGMNLLSTADELELLLNVEFSDYYQFDMYYMTGDLMSSTMGMIPNILTQPTPSRNSILLTWDDTNLKRFAELTTHDEDYDRLFGYIGKIANPILSSVEYATGDEAKKKQIQAEALCLRAWAEFLLVNKFAAAYNPANAETTPGIPYLMEDWDITIPPEKWTVKQVYDQIVKDCNDAIELNSLPEKNINQMRWSKACPYAIKALALIAMQEFDEAEAAAKESLKVNSAVADYWSDEYTEQIMCFMNPTLFYPAVLRPLMNCPEDLFHTATEIKFMPMRTTECDNQLEAGHAALDRMPTDGMRFMYVMSQAQMSCGVPYTMIWDMSGCGSSWNMYGLKSTQQMLIVAECEIRKGNIDEAMGYLDDIRRGRINPETYAPLKGNVNTKDAAVAALKQTALGENVFSVYNFIERKRWNQLDDMKETLKKNILGNEFTLAPDSKMWIFPFPGNAVDNNPNLKQNSYDEDAAE